MENYTYHKAGDGDVTSSTITVELTSALSGLDVDTAFQLDLDQKTKKKLN